MRKEINHLLFGVILIAMVGAALCAPSLVVAKDAAYYQPGLTPAASRLLFTMQGLSRNGEYEMALQKFERYRQGRDFDQGLPALLGFMAANLNFQLGNYRESVALYSRVVAQAPEFYLAYENYGMALLLVEDYQEATRVLLQAAALVPAKSSQLRYKAAIAALYAEDFEQARSLLVALTSPSPNLPSPPPAAWLKALIQAHWQLSEASAAVVVAEKLVDNYDLDLAHWRIYGQIALAAGNYRKALSAYKVVQTEGVISLDERKLIARIYQQLGLLREAAGVLEAVFLEIEPTAVELNRLVAIYRQTGQIDKALQSLNLLQKLNPKSANLMTHGEILYSAGRYREAGQIFASIPAITEADGRQFILAGYCAWNRDHFPAAAGFWEQAATYPAQRKQAQSLIRTLQPWLN